MKAINSILKSTFCLSLFLLSSYAAAGPIVIGGTTYERSGNSETGLSASFGDSSATVAPSTATANTYSGFVELIVSGVGQASGTAYNDAFYVYTDSSGNALATPTNGDHYQLAADTGTITGQSGSPTPANQYAKNLVAFDIDAMAEASTLPLYRADHTYNFVIDVTDTAAWTGVAAALNFGVANGVFSDNSGAYSIDVYQLASVPEPGTMLLLLSGLLGIGSIKRSKAS